MDVPYDEGEVVATNVYGDVCIRKARRKRQKVLVKELLYDYATNTTLHGLSYTTKRGLTLIENMAAEKQPKRRIFWLVTFIASICYCSYLINNVWLKWKRSPVIVTVSEKLVPVRTVPFPSVMICPQSKSMTTAAYNYTAESIRLSNIVKNQESTVSHAKDFAKFKDITNVCGPYNMDFDDVLPRNYSNVELVENILDVAPKESDIFQICYFRGTNMVSCQELLKKTLTSEGLCYTVNSLAADDILRLDSIHKNYTYLAANTPIKNWSLDYGYTEVPDDNITVYPTRGSENGAFPDLEILMMDELKYRDPTCNIVNAGYKIYIQHPADFPQSSLYYFAALNEQVSSMALSFSILNTSETLKDYDAEVRQCYFPNERYLKYFKIYTANNCKIECLTNFTYKKCGCVGFYMPFESSERICTIDSTSCMILAREELVQIEANKDSPRRCRCLPACNSVDYGAEILKTDFNFKTLLKTDIRFKNFAGEFNGTQFSKLEMYFKRSRFVSMHRSELFGLTDFLANIGGLLGLFLGFSFLSLVELFYFLTLRLYFTLKKDLKEEKLQRQDTIKRKY